MDRNLKTLLAVSFLVVGLLQGANLMVDVEEASLGGLLWFALLAFGSLIFWLWIWREQRPSADKAAQSIEAAEDEAAKLDASVKQSVAIETLEADEPTPPAAEAYADDERDTASEPVMDATASPQYTEMATTESDESDDDDSNIASEPVVDAEETPPEPEPEPEPASDDPDDLSRIEGIGPKYQELLLEAGIDTYAKLAQLDEERIATLIREMGGRKSASMATWAEQAKLAAAGDWDGLAALQDELSGGRRD
jgi:predicted flap endonuclease-1-like 5' DNA nuclease